QRPLFFVKLPKPAGALHLELGGLGSQGLIQPADALGLPRSPVLQNLGLEPRSLRLDVRLALLYRRGFLLEIGVELAPTFLRLAAQELLFGRELLLKAL